MKHPSWCAIGNCTAEVHTGRGSHVSRAVILDPDRLTFLAARVRLVQDLPIEGYPDSDAVLVELTINLPTYDPQVPEEEFCVVLAGAHAQGLGRMLVSAGRAAG
jgi:hypothetical protein